METREGGQIHSLTTRGRRSGERHHLPAVDSRDSCQRRDYPSAKKKRTKLSMTCGPGLLEEEPKKRTRELRKSSEGNNHTETIESAARGRDGAENEYGKDPREDSSRLLCKVTKRQPQQVPGRGTTRKIMRRTSSLEPVPRTKNWKEKSLGFLLVRTRGRFPLLPLVEEGVPKKNPSICLQRRSRSHELGGWWLILQTGEDLRYPWGLRETREVIVVRRMLLAGMEDTPAPLVMELRKS
jgi:hypothetical protein